MSTDAIDGPVRARENSNEDQGDESSTGETTLQNNSGRSGPCENPNVADSQVNDSQHGGENGQTESSLVNSNQNQTQSDKNHEKGGQSQVQQETEKNVTLPPKNNQTHEQVQRDSVYPKQETSTPRTYSEVTTGITNPTPPYNLRSRQNAPETILVRLLLYY